MLLQFNWIGSRETIELWETIKDCDVLPNTQYTMSCQSIYTEIKEIHFVHASKIIKKNLSCAFAVQFNSIFHSN